MSISPQKAQSTHKISTDFAKVANSQLAILATTINKDNFSSVTDQIHQIVQTVGAPEIYIKFFRRLLLTNSTLIPTNVSLNDSVQELIEFELKYLAHNHPNYLQQVLFSFDSDLLNLFDLKDLFVKYSLNDFEKISLTLALQKKEHSESYKSIVSNSLPGLIKSLKSHKLPIESLLLLENFFRADYISIFEKLVLHNSIIYSHPDTDHSAPPSKELYAILSQMEFTEILSGLGPEHIIPERLLSDLLAIQSHDKLQEAAALLLSEILSPGSQSLTGNAGEITSLTPANIPEASAKGSQFGSILRKLSKPLDWNDIFSKMNSKLSNSTAFSQAALSELLSALDDQTIDAFLAFYWSMNIRIALLIALRQLNPSNGSFDLLRTNYLKPIINDPSFPNIKSSVLFFANVTYLELSCISNSDAIESMEYKQMLNKFFEDDIRAAPELIALGCVFYTPKSDSIDVLLGDLFAHLLDESSPYLTLIVKNMSKDVALNVAKKLLKVKGTIYQVVLSYLVEHKLLIDFLDSLEFEIGLPIAVQAVKSGFNEFANYLAKHIDSTDKMVEFLRIQSSLEEKTTSVKAIYILLQSITNSKKVGVDELSTIQAQILQAFPRLINFGFGHDEAILSNGDANTFPFDVEQQMKVLYEKMYSSEIEIKEVITMLQTLRDSDNPRDQDVFACMIHSLLDEYRFFPEYPLNALAITSVLFGSMIHFNLIRGTALTIALKYVLESCRQPPESNMYKFAVQALYAFRQRLQEYPNYCSVLANIESLKSQQQVYQHILNVVNEEEKPQPAFKSIHSTTTSYETPKTDISQRVQFIINNLSDENLKSKAPEFKAVLSPPIYQWFANHLVLTRVKTEPNNHHLYAAIVEAVEDETLFDHVVAVSVDEANDLLNAEESPTQRSYLKNLGSWLGRITLRRDKPLKHKNIALKELLVEAYDISKLSLVIPFVCKIIDQTKESEIFRLPNPWTLGIMKTLSELYEFTELKLNLRFEIEVLCNNLSIELQTIEPSTIIRNHDDIHHTMASLSLQPTEQPQLPPQLPVQFQPQQQVQPQVQQQPQAPQSQQLPQPPLAMPPRQLPQVGESPFQNLAGSSSFVVNPALKRLFVMALTKSVREILPPAVERAVSIAVTTAKSLIVKDFATEPDETKMRSGAYMLVRQLAQGLALATCRDPLKESIQSTFHNLASQLGAVETSLLDELPQAINDNIDIACSVIEKAAMDKAVQEIEDILAAGFTMRHQHRERQPDQPFISQYASAYSLNLPEPLSIRAAGVTPQQFQVYENFGKHERPLMPSTANVGAVNATTPVASATTPASLGGNAQLNAPPEVQIQSLIDILLQNSTENPSKRLSEIPEDSSIHLVLAQIISFIVKNLAREALLMKLSRFILNALLTTSESDLSVDCLIYVLEKLCDLSASIKKDVSWWLVHGQDNRKFNLKIILPLYASKIISPSEFDAPLSLYINEGQPEAVTFASALIKSSLTFHTDYIQSFCALKQKVPEEFWESLNESNAFQKEIHNESNKLSYIFTEWIRLQANEKLRSVFIYQLFTSGILTNPEHTVMFIKNAAEISVEYFKESDPENDGFLATDAFSKLIVRLLVAQQDEGESTKANFFKLCLSVISLVFAEDHATSKETFNERPYFRIFSTLLSEWSEVKCEDFNANFYLLIADFLNTFQPLAFPGFAFAWITLISHRLFLPNILELDHPKAKGKFTLLILGLLRFQSKYVKQKQIPEVFSVIYKGTLRIFLLLLHDFPEVLVQHHHQLCCEIPPSFIQLRNIVLSAFPKNITMPDPFTQGLKVDRLPEIAESPVIAYNLGNDLKSLRKSVDNYLRIPSNMLLKTILNGLKQSPTDEAGIGYSRSNFNIKLINVLVLYIGSQAINERQSSNFNTKSPHFALLSGLMQEGSIEFQYHFIEAICNQLRYPNAHTHWFSYIVLHFFGAQSLWNGKRLQVQQIITRVLLERVICNRPHPWGLLITFTELLKNTELAFFDSSFIKSEPEIEKMFESLLHHISSNSTNGTNKPSVN